nr:hypothetical protein [Oceanobacillus alkalisoli]
MSSQQSQQDKEYLAEQSTKARSFGIILRNFTSGLQRTKRH